MPKKRTRPRMYYEENGKGWVRAACPPRRYAPTKPRWYPLKG